MKGPFAAFKWQALWENRQVLLEGLGVTALTSLLALALALVLGVIVGVAATGRLKGVRAVCRGYVELIQNTPLVVQVFFLYNGLPYLKIVLPVFAVGVIGIGVYHGAYVSEVVRAGIEAIAKGQKEAAYSQGFGYWGAMRHVILPQATRMMLPPLTNQAIFLVKNTSVLAMVAGGDLMYRADSWASESLYYGPAYVVTGLLYLAICLPLSRVARRLEHAPEAA